MRVKSPPRRAADPAKPMPQTPPQDVEALHAEISRSHAGLSRRLRQIAAFALEHPTAMALETIADIAQSADVQPSALIRFAQSFGYSGFSEMQKVFQQHVAAQSAGYKERVRQELSKNREKEPESPYSLLQQYCEANIVSMRHLQDGISAADLNRAVKLMAAADQIYLIGQRRSFPIAAYLAYALARSECRVNLLDGNGGMLLDQARGMRRGDLLVAISFHPYSQETIDVAALAQEQRVPWISISDSKLSPIAEKAAVHLGVHDAEVHSFRSLTASMCLAQTLATSLAFQGKRRSKIKKGSE
jgi:DNA-binding MurR/RpiR family transcriptional regulator